MHLNFGRFFEELRRRKVFRVAAGYAIVAWLVIQIAANTFPALHLPNWSLTLVVVLTILGFPIALVLAWGLELTPEGLRAQRGAEPGAIATAPPSQVPRVMNHPRALRQRSAPPLIAIVPSDESPENGPVRRKRAALATLRHDLRTPMNALLGYGQVLVEEAGELAIGPIVPDVQRLHAAAKRLLEQIDVCLPPGGESEGDDTATIRARIHESLLGPATALLEQCRRLCDAGSAYPLARPDLERLVSAAEKLRTLLEALALPTADTSQAEGHDGLERVLRRPGEVPGGAGASQGGTLLVVDDNPLNIDLLTRQLVREGYHVFSASSGREALEQLRQHDVELVLLDMVMPEMDGLQVLEAIADDPALRDIPVVMTSALDEMDAVVRCLEHGAVDYLPKPFDPVLLRARVSATLQISQLRSDLRHVEQALGESRAASAQLARSLAPSPFSDSLARGERMSCAHYPEVTAVLVRFDGLDAISSRLGPGEMLARVAAIHAHIERCSAARALPILRVADRACTILVGAPDARPDHASVAADLALELIAYAGSGLSASDRPELRVGLHTGAAVAGVVGDERLAFGLWGDAVSTADAIAYQTPPGSIQASGTTCAKFGQVFELASPLTMDVPGQGRMRTYTIVGRRTGAPVS